MQFNNGTDVYNTLVNAVLSHRETYSIFSNIAATFIVIGIILIVLRFMYAVAKGEIQSMEQFFGFIAERGVRFLVAVALLLPSPGFISQYGLPLAMDLTLQMGKVAFVTGDQFAAALGSTSMTKMPLFFKQTLDKSAEKVKNGYNESQQRRQSLQEISAKKSAESSGGSFFNFIGSLFKQASDGVGMVLSALPNVLDPIALLNNILHGFAALVGGALDGIFDFIANIIIFVSMTTIIYGLIVITSIHFIILAPIFFLSAVLLFFDRKKDQVFNNFISLITIMFRPVGIVLGFHVVTVAYTVFNFLTDTAFLTVLNNQSTISFWFLIVLSLVSAFSFVGVAGAILKNIQTFFSNMIGSNATFGLSANLR